MHVIFIVFCQYAYVILPHAYKSSYAVVWRSLLTGMRDPS